MAIANEQDNVTLVREVMEEGGTVIPELETLSPESEEGLEATSEEAPISVEERMAHLEETMSEGLGKFQSLYDKNLSEWGKLKQLLEQGVQGQQQPQQTGAEQPVQKLNPWDEGYTDQLLNSVERRVGTAVQQQMAVVQEQVAMQNLTSELKGEKYKLNDDQVKEFVDFYSQPKGEMSMDTLVKVFLESHGSRSTPPSSLEAVRAGKAAPTSPGARPSATPPPMSDKDKQWKAVMDFQKSQQIF